MARTREEQQHRQTKLQRLVGRKEEKRIFRQALQSLKESRAQNDVLAVMVSAWSGFGKSGLLTQFEEICSEEGVYWIKVDPKESDQELSTLPLLLERIHQAYLDAYQDGLTNRSAFKEFEQLMVGYRKVRFREKTERLPEEGLTGPPAPGHHKRTERELWSNEQPRYPERPSDFLSLSRLWEIVRGKQQPVNESQLAKALAEGLHAACDGRPLLVMLDTYERLSRLDVVIQRSFIDPLMKKTTEHPTLVVFSGQDILSMQDQLGDIIPLDRVQPLEPAPLKPDEMRDYLRNKVNITNDALVDAIVSTTPGIPVLLPLVVQKVRRYSSEQDALQAFRYPGMDITLERALSNLQQDWLDGLPPAQRALLRAGAILRRFDGDSLKAVLDTEDVGDLTSLLRIIPSTLIEFNSDENCTIHESIRNVICRDLKRFPPAERLSFKNLNQRAAKYYHQRQLKQTPKDNLRFDDEEWRRLAAEWLYHLAQADERQGTEELLRQAADAIWYVKYDACLQLLDAFVDKPLSDQDREWLPLLRKGVEADRQEDREQAIQVYSDLLEAEPPAGENSTRNCE